MRTLSLVLLAVLAVILIARYAAGRAAHRLSRYRGLDRRKLLRLLEMLMQLGYEDGALVIRSTEGDAFLQVLKYVRGERTGLELSFPRAPWSLRYFDQVGSYLQRVGVPTGRYHTNSDVVDLFLDADLGRDIDSAEHVVRHIAEEILGIDLETGAEAKFQRVQRVPYADPGRSSGE